MVFSSIIFLFLFLPATLLLYFGAGRKLRNTVLLGVSLLFYAWGEGGYVLLMIGSIAMNYLFGIIIAGAATAWRKKVFLSLIVVLDLAPLLYFKYSYFALDNIGKFLSLLHVDHSFTPVPVHLPLGISFFTFHTLSYVIDVYRGIVTPQKNPLDMGLYIALFPQFIAGPIVRYHDLAKQLLQRSVRLADFSLGVERFVFGLGKKVLLANPMGAMADRIFALGIDQLSTVTAWLGIVCYTLQIYFDFSGYSDMAIGLARMFGFRFLENFNYPYISRSIREFWRRWHISLSNWFRDYLYIPLGGNRKGAVRTGLNLLLVFLLCGFWHGASWNFVIWGLVYGLFLVLERGRVGTWLDRLPAAVQHLYVIMVVTNAWVFFRAETLGQALRYLGVMYGLAGAGTIYPEVYINLDLEFYCALALALVLSIPVYPVLSRALQHLDNLAAARHALAVAVPAVKLSFLALVLLFATMNLATGAYNPFIYFRF